VEFWCLRDGDPPIQKAFQTRHLKGFRLLTPLGVRWNLHMLNDPIPDMNPSHKGQTLREACKQLSRAVVIVLVYVWTSMRPNFCCEAMHMLCSLTNETAIFFVGMERSVPRSLFEVLVFTDTTSLKIFDGLTVRDNQGKFYVLRSICSRSPHMKTTGQSCFRRFEPSSPQQNFLSYLGASKDRK